MDSTEFRFATLCSCLFIFVQFIVMFDHVRSIWTHVSQTARDGVDHASAANDSCRANLGRGSLSLLPIAPFWPVWYHLRARACRAACGVLNPPSFDRCKRLNGTNQNEQRLPCRVLADLGRWGRFEKFKVDIIKLYNWNTRNHIVHRLIGHYIVVVPCCALFCYIDRHTLQNLVANVPIKGGQWWPEETGGWLHSGVPADAMGSEWPCATALLWWQLCVPHLDAGKWQIKKNDLQFYACLKIGMDQNMNGKYLS